MVVNRCSLRVILSPLGSIGIYPLLIKFQVLHLFLLQEYISKNRKSRDYERWPLIISAANLYLKCGCRQYPCMLTGIALIRMVMSKYKQKILVGIIPPLFKNLALSHNICLPASFSSLLLQKQQPSKFSAFSIGSANSKQKNIKINIFYARANIFLLVCQFYQAQPKNQWIFCTSKIKIPHF